MENKTTRKKRRTTEEVKSDIMQAVGRVLESQGVGKLGVETVAAEAGMDKAMLYRHYKDFNDILKCYVESEDFWINFLGNEYGTFDENNLVSFVSEMIEKQFKELLANKKLQELIVWELVDKSQLMKNVAQKREDLAIDILNGIKALFPYNNISSNNVFAIITAGIYYLVLHKNISTFCGLDLNDKEHQKQFSTDLLWLIARILSPRSELERVAINCINKGFDDAVISDITGLEIDHIKKLHNL
ncbi:MAG: TetR/AcrR family transcriptional regulator [Spirochaetes bacterium]|nr:TetR/AcrR family transcriptional regulator [Spirochaetota bacterium]